MKRIGKELSINEEIRAREVRVVSDANEQLGIMTLHEAISLAEEKGLDLVEVAPNGHPPVCRIMNYGKYRYEQQKRDKEAKKKQQTIDIKEVQLSCRIDTHDFETKLKHARRFLDDGNKVKVCVKFKGREMSHTSIGHDIIVKFGEALSDIGVIEKMPVLDGRQMKPLPKMGYGESATWEVEGAYQVEDEKERLNEAISLIWKWKLVIGLICMSAGAGLALAERRRKEENIKKNKERNDKGKEE